MKATHNSEIEFVMASAVGYIEERKKIGRIAIPNIIVSYCFASDIAIHTNSVENNNVRRQLILRCPPPNTLGK